MRPVQGAPPPPLACRCRLRRGEEGQGQEDGRASGHQGAAFARGQSPGAGRIAWTESERACACCTDATQVVDKSRYAAGDNSLEREIQVLLKVRRGELLPSTRRRTGPGPHHGPGELLPSAAGRPPELHPALRRVYHAAQGLHRHRARHRGRAAGQVRRGTRPAHLRAQKRIIRPACRAALHCVGALGRRVTERGNYSEKEAAAIIRQILDGVSYLHGQGAPVEARVAAARGSRVVVQPWPYRAASAAGRTRRCRGGGATQRGHSPNGRARCTCSQASCTATSSWRT